MKRLTLIMFFCLGLLLSAQEKSQMSKMFEKYSFGLIINIPDKDLQKIKEFSELGKEHGVSVIPHKTYLYVAVLNKDIEEATIITNAFNELVKKYKLELIMQKLPSKK